MACSVEDDKPRYIDLHIHTKYSDGTRTPGEVLEEVRAEGVSAFAITDHDSIDGIHEILKLQLPNTIKFLTGVEISASYPNIKDLDFNDSGFNNSGITENNFSDSDFAKSTFRKKKSLHILGYQIDIKNELLNKELSKLQKARKNRNPEIIKKLNTLGFNISIEDLVKSTDTENIGRPHIARYMLGKGYIKSMNEAFDKYLGYTQPAYVDKKRINCEKAIKMILAAGGIPVLAHPGFAKVSNLNELENLIIILKEMGLKGMEVYYPEHSKKQTALYLSLAKKYKLLVTGGSDFHGSIKPEIKIGKGDNNLFIPYEIYEKIINYEKIT